MYDDCFSPAEQDGRHQQILQMLRARSVAFIGGEGVTPALNYVKDLGFTGQIAVVNSRRPMVAGVGAVPSVQDLPFVPDVAFVAINSQAAVGVVRELAAYGVGAIVCNASGFAEIGPSGVALQQELVEAAGDAILVGPNCNGFVNYLDGVAAMVGHMGIRTVVRGAALMSQGGGFILDVALSRRSLPISYIVGTGNSAMIGAPDCAHAVLGDDRVTAIGLYLEGNLNVQKLSHMGAAALEKGVPVVVLKSGRSSAGARAVHSHTASIAGEDALVEALFERLGFIQTTSISELVETLKVLTITGAPAGRRVGIISSSGVESALAADAADAAGLDVPSIAPGDACELKAVLPSIATPNNPLDLTTVYWGDRDKQADCCEGFLKIGFDFAVCVATYPPEGTRPIADWDASVDGFVEALRRTGTKGAIVCSLAENMPEQVGRRVAALGTTPLQGTKDGMKAVANAAAYVQHRARILEEGASSVRIPDRPGASNGTRQSLDEHEAKLRLARAGIAVPNGVVVDGIVPPLTLAAPYAVKLLSREVMHKSDIGAVRLGAMDETEVLAATRAIASSVRSAAAHLDCRRFLIEEMVTESVGELLLGLRRDPHLGLAIVLGSGGLAVELYCDRKILFLPVTRKQVQDALLELKAGRMFSGFRGRPPGDLAAVINTVMRFAAFIEQNADRVQECEINPLMVRPEGGGAVAVDAVIVETTIH